MRKLRNAARNSTRLEQLKILSVMLAEEMETDEGKENLAQLAKQYRETLKEIEEIEGATEGDDEVGELLSGRAADGKPGAVRKGRAPVQIQ